MNQADLAARSARATRAKLLIEDELLKEAFAYLEKLYFDQWLKSLPEETDKREKFHAAATVLTAVQGHLRNVISDGRLADYHIAELGKLSPSFSPQFHA